MPDVSIGRFIRDVPRKLMKERGQHLDAFINVFLSSTVTQNKSKAKLVSEGKLVCVCGGGGDIVVAVVVMVISF